MYCCQCGSVNYRKNGLTRGKQRYLCKDCGYNFTNVHGRGYSPEVQIQALKLYAENMGIRSIARFLEVDPSTVMLWVRNEGQKLMKRLQQAVPKSIDGMDIIEIDEMWHYTQKNSGNSGYGLLYLEKPGASSPSKLALVVAKPCASSGQK